MSVVTATLGYISETKVLLENAPTGVIQLEHFGPRPLVKKTVNQLCYYGQKTFHPIDQLDFV